MDWFTTKGQAVQTIAPIVALLIVLIGLFVAARYGEPAMSSGNFSSAGAVLFYLIMILVSVLSIFAIWFSSRKWKEQIQSQEKLPLTKVESPSPAPASSHDEANKAKIAQIFRTHGKPASEHIQQIAAELCGQLNSSDSREKRAIAEIARRGLSIPCAFTCNTLSRALEEEKESFPMLRRDLEDFFLAYLRLVLCVQTIDGLLERNVPPDKKRILWQEDHNKFRDDLRKLFAEEDFSTSQARMKEGQHGPLN